MPTVYKRRVVHRCGAPTKPGPCRKTVRVEGDGCRWHKGGTPDPIIMDVQPPGTIAELSAVMAQGLARVVAGTLPAGTASSLASLGRATLAAMRAGGATVAGDEVEEMSEEALKEELARMSGES